MRRCEPYSVHCLTSKSFILQATLLGLVLATVISGRVQDLEQGFHQPPAEARPRTWWHWVSGNVSKEGITLDLEAMKRIGLAEAQIFNVNQGPAGAVKTLSDEWRQLTGHAIREADRLGLELAFQNRPGWSESGGPWVKPEESMQFVYVTEAGITGGKKVNVLLPAEKRPAWRDIAVWAFPTPPADLAKPADLKARREQVSAKAAYKSDLQSSIPMAWDVPAEAVIDPKTMVNLTDRLQPDGRLEWDAPPGAWTVLRFGHASNGRKNAPAMPEATGLECDKLSRAAVTAHFNGGMMGMVLQEAGPLAGKSLKNVLADSWEAGCLNWTPAMREEFRKRRGYDPLPWLPTLTGRIVGSVDQSDRFLWDFRRVIADLLAENHYGVIQELAHEHGMQFYAEAPGIGMPTVADELQCKARTDVPMGEFWLDGHGSADVKEAASAAHINGLRWAAAESFTSAPQNASWKNDPFGIKALGDKHFCLGLNRIVFHRYAHQPFTDKYPGVSMGPWGLNFERTQTWWEQARAWIEYIARCQWMLSRGQFVADVCYFYGEGAPNTLPDRQGLRPAIPAGFDYDGCDAETFQKMEVHDGRLTLPGGMSYGLLVLAEADRMTPRTLAKVRQLVQSGATVIGRPPRQSPSLQDYSQADEEVRTLVAELWGKDSASQKVIDRRLGRGRVVYGKPVAEVLGEMAIVPDFRTAGADAPIMAVHRHAAEGEIYFVSNQAYQTLESDCTFRVAGRVPELWHPDSGAIEPAPVYRQADGCTTVSLRFDPAGSVFVVFRKPVGKQDAIVSLAHDGGGTAAPRLEIRRATYAAVDDASRKMDVTAKIAELTRSGRVDIRVGNDVFGRDPALNHVKHLVVEYSLGGKPQQAAADEGQTLYLPSESGPAACELVIAADRARLTAWTPGTYTARFASGKQWRHEVAGLLPAVELSGGWTLRFPPHWGAPDQVTLDKLISWSNHADDGVRHFSGTATYSRGFELTAEQLASGRALRLSLGEVKNLAEVTINGWNAGILWKPPFAINLAGLVQPGRNTLEIRVTNLWPNRLIGDKNLPPEKRFTWTTVDLYKADSPLLPSGLLGPVTLETGQILPVEP